MKAEELMAGDILQYRSQIAAFDFRVEEITKHKVGYRVDLEDKCLISYLRLSEVQPIPITAKILERNEFEKNQYFQVKEKHQWTWRKGVLTNVSLFCCGNTDDAENGWMISILSPSATLCCRIDSLHHIQHALRLCNIEKKITLY